MQGPGNLDLVLHKLRIHYWGVVGRHNAFCQHNTPLRKKFFQGLIVQGPHRALSDLDTTFDYSSSYGTAKIRGKFLVTSLTGSYGSYYPF